MSLKSRISESGNKGMNVGLASFHSLPVTVVPILCFFPFVLLETLILEFGVGGAHC